MVQMLSGGKNDACVFQSSWVTLSIWDVAFRPLDVTRAFWTMPREDQLVTA